MIELFSLGNIKDELKLLPKYFNSDDTLGGANNRHIPHLEDKFSELTCRTATSVNSCTNGIYLALRKMNLNQDPVLLPPIIFFGIGASVIKAGGIPVLSSVDQDGIMCEKSVERALNSTYHGKKIKCIIPAHINGLYFDTTKFEKEVTIIEDTAPAYGVRTKQNKCLVSSSNNISIISFSFAKPLTSGEGGMIFSDQATSDWMKSHRYCGLDKLQGRYGIGEFEVTEPDLKFPFNALAAMLISIKLKSADEDLLRRKKIAAAYQQTYGKNNEADFYENGNHLTYMIRSQKRELIENKLKEAGVGFYYNHRPIYRFKAFEDLLFTSPEDRVQTEDYFNKVLHIPSRQDLTDEQVEHIRKNVLI